MNKLQSDIFCENYSLLELTVNLIIIIYTINDLITAPGCCIFKGGGNNVTNCTSVGASQIFKNYYIILHISII